VGARALRGSPDRSRRIPAPELPRPRAGGRHAEGRPERGRDDGDGAGLPAHASGRCGQRSA
jgi:hypothetical protein